ncbi:MAG: hypothetical protein K8L99_15015, partial [Anaerolineae bacterium]|nr:hypothetical protein [Anaerolineae bacterium]
TKFNPLSGLRSISRKIHEFIEDCAEMAPYKLKMMSQSYGQKDISKQSDFNRREMLIYQWLNHDRAYLGKDHYEYGRHWVMLGELYASASWPGAGLSYYEKGLKIYRLSLEETHPLIVKVKGLIAHCHNLTGKFELAEPLYGDIAQARLSEDISLDLKIAAIDDWRRCLEAQEKYDEAIKIVLQIVALIENAVVLDRNRAISSYSILGGLYQKAGQKDLANLFSTLAKELDTLSIVEKACGREAFTLKRDLEKIKSLYLKLGKNDIAAGYRERIELLDLLRKVSQDEYPGIEDDLEAIARYYEKRNEGGDPTVAHKHRRRAKLICERRRERMASKHKVGPTLFLQACISSLLGEPLSFPCFRYFTETLCDPLIYSLLGAFL